MVIRAGRNIGTQTRDLRKRVKVFLSPNAVETVPALSKVDHHVHPTPMRVHWVRVQVTEGADSMIGSVAGLKGSTGNLSSHSFLMFDEWPRRTSDWKTV